MPATKHTNADRAKTRAVEFKRRAPEAQQIFVAGTFNEWKLDASPRVRDKVGCLRSSPKLALGCHEFKFVVDGRRCCDSGCTGDHACPNCVPNEFGSMNRALEV